MITIISCYRSNKIFQTIKTDNMILSERRNTEKYRKRLRLSYLIILILSLWLIRKYNDTSYLVTDKEMLEYDIINKDSEMSKLKHQIDSLSKPKEEVIVKETTVPPRVRKVIQDTVKQLPKVEVIKQIESDTL
jgi:hypothetical protein